jgi:hypothetical protein
MKKEVTIADVYELIEQFRKEVREQYVTKDEFLPVKSIVYGLVGIMSLTVVGALLSLVIRTVIAKQ